MAAPLQQRAAFMIWPIERKGFSVSAATVPFVGGAGFRRGTASVLTTRRTARPGPHPSTGPISDVGHRQRGTE
jgi:hypothetical protein